MYIFTDKNGKFIEAGNFMSYPAPGQSAKAYAEKLTRQKGEPVFAWILVGGQDEKSLTIDFA